MKPLLRISSLVTHHQLAKLLSGRLTWRQILRTALAYQRNSMSSARLLGFIPSPEFSAEILLTCPPLMGIMTPVASLTYAHDRWSAMPMIVSTERLLGMEVVAVAPVDWIMTLGNLASDMRGRSDWQNLDLPPWVITASWPYWEVEAMSWEKRAKDLAGRLGTNPFVPNTLTVKCRRLGLMRK